MKRLLITLLLLLAMAGLVQGQTTVNLLVQDVPDNQTWNNGTWQVMLIPAAGNPDQTRNFRILSGGGSTTSQSGTLSSTGTASMVLPANANVAPTGTLWQFTVCSQQGTACSIANITITASSPQSVTISPPSIRVTANPNLPPITVYTTTEISSAAIGSQITLVGSTPTTPSLQICTAVSGNTCITWSSSGSSAAAGGSPPQTQVNDPGNPGHFGGTPCENFPSLTLGPINADCDWHSKGPNPGFDITRYGARAFIVPAQTTTATCVATNTSITLASAIDFKNGDGISLTECGAATSLSTPAAPSSVVPKGILNGASTVSYEIVAEDYANGRTAASSATTIATANGTFGTIVRTISTATLAAGTITVVTTANHNFQAGERVKLAGTGTIMNGVWRVASIVNATTFTIATQYVRRLDQNVSASVGTAESPSHIFVNWTTAPNVLRYLIYRQDGGAGSYNLVGVAPGREPFYDDNGYGMAAATDIGPNVSATAPASATNQSIATTIVSGAGTTTIVVANAPSNSKSGSFAHHDNSVAVGLAASAAAGTIGGQVLIPNSTNASFYITFPLQIPAGDIGFQVNGNIWEEQPIIPNSFSNFYGGSGNGLGLPSFARTYYGGQIGGPSNPLIFLPGLTNTSFDHLIISGSSNVKQQWIFLADNAASGATAGSTEVNLTNSYIAGGNGNNGSSPVVIRGGGFRENLLNNVYVNNGTTSYFSAPSIRLAGSAVSSPAGLPGIGTLRDASFVGAGVGVDADALNGTGLTVGFAWVFDNIFTESLCAPLFQFQNIVTNTWSNWEIKNIDSADAQCGGSTPIIDMTALASSSLTGLRIQNSGFVNIGNAAAQISMVSSDATAAVNITSGHIHTMANTYTIGNAGTITTAAPRQAIEVNGGAIRVVSPGKIFTEGDPPTSLSCAVQAGGSLTIGTFNVVVTAVDFDGGETALSAPSTVTTSTGNQTVNCSWTAPSPAPASYNLYFNSARLNGGPILTTSSVQGAIFGASLGFQSGGGPSGMNRGTGIWSDRVNVPNGRFASTQVGFPYTVNRTATWPDASGLVVVSSNFNSAYDNFNRANGGLGTNWTTPTGENALAITGNQVAGGTAAVVNHQYWNATTYGNDEFSQATITTLPTVTDQIGITARVSTTARTYYLYRCTATPTRDLLKNVAGTFTTLSTVAAACVVGDVLRLQVVGNTQTAFRNGVQDLTASDTAIPTGANVGMFTVGTSGVADNWSGGNLHPIAHLDLEQDWTQPQHFTQPVTIGTTNPVAGTLAAGLYSPRYTITGGAAPTCAVTGAGTGATCTMSSFSTDNSGAMQINSGTTPGSSGTWTLTFSAGFPNAAFCTVGPGSGGTVLNARATVFDNTNGTLGVHSGVWDNNAVAINASQAITFIISYVCGGH